MKAFFQKRLLPPLGILMLMLLLGPYGDTRVSALDKTAYRSLKTFSEVLDLVEKNYVEEVDTKKLIQGAINGMIKSLDPHSTFMTADMFKELEVDTRGSFGGVGIEITLQKDVLTVVSPIEDTPAYKAGVQAGDRIIMIDGQSTKDITITEAVKKLRGPKNTKVTITIFRDTLPKPKDIVLVRDEIKVKSIKQNIYDEHVGYIRLAAFQERTVDDLKKALRDIDAKARPLTGIVLDMRNNPGGLLNQAVEVSDAFMKSGTIVSTRGRNKNMESRSRARDDGNEPTCPIVILVNEGTASAAEIVAGALQDSGIAVIVGTQTFGKGSVQTVIPLEDGAALKLTTAKYYTPKGRSIQAEGITPDIVVKRLPPPEEKDTKEKEVFNHIIREQDLSGHIPSPKEKEKETEKDKAAAKKPVAKPEQEELTKDNQLKTAVDILKGWAIMKKNAKE